MIQLTCDKCDKTLDVGDDLAGKKVKCPACGDINVVPGSPTSARSSSGPDRAAAAGYPASSGPEQPVVRIRRAMFRARPILFLFLVLALIAGAAGGLYFWALATPTNSTLGSVFGIIALIAILALAIWKVLSLGEALEITTKRTVERNGIFSKSTSEVMHRDIRNLQVHQTFRDRLFGVGRLQISSAADDESEIIVTDIPKPKKVREIIDLYRPM